jgi:hypothetical protein
LLLLIDIYLALILTFKQILVVHRLFTVSFFVGCQTPILRPFRLKITVATRLGFAIVSVPFARSGGGTNGLDFPLA